MIKSALTRKTMGHTLQSPLNESPISTHSSFLQRSACFQWNQSNQTKEREDKAMSLTEALTCFKATNRVRQIVLLVSSLSLTFLKEIRG